ncbi:hypothetical protein EVAR_98907_1 [Eumeta japonica]|uniref:Uncharacterized protein n=1 Tax=Eumeta variegata TaxID=151549 RepID=A0A4C1Y2E5_EUMVA|nr:hypothetical protein EVAR_98907_1 [Eumeta japonica]
MFPNASYGRSWRSLHAVRSRHLSASAASSLLGRGPVSQRDLALTQFGFLGFALLKPDKIGALAFEPGDWRAYIHFWRTMGYMIGIEDRYNLCRKTEQETRQVCQYVLERVFTPALENVPEYFEHMARVMLDGMWSINPTVDCDAALYYCKYLADVPGYVTTEGERVRLYENIRASLKDKPETAGLEVTSLIQKPAIEGLPDKPCRQLHLKDYEVFNKSMQYNRLNNFIFKFGVATKGLRCGVGVLFGVVICENIPILLGERRERGDKKCFAANFRAAGDILAKRSVVLIPTLMYGSESWVWQKKNESEINVVEMLSLHSMCRASRKGKCRNGDVSDLREQCGLKKDVVPRVERGILRWFGIW